MGSKLLSVTLFDETGQFYEVDTAKSAAKLLASIASGRLTKANALAAKKLLAAPKVAEVLEKYGYEYRVVTQSEKEKKIATFSYPYLRALAELADSRIWDGVTITVEGGRSRKRQTEPEELDI